MITFLNVISALGAFLFFCLSGLSLAFWDTPAVPGSLWNPMFIIKLSSGFLIFTGVLIAASRKYGKVWIASLPVIVLVLAILAAAYFIHKQQESNLAHTKQVIKEQEQFFKTHPETYFQCVASEEKQIYVVISSETVNLITLTTRSRIDSKIGEITKEKVLLIKHVPIDFSHKEFFAFLDKCKNSSGDFLKDLYKITSAN